MVILSINQTLSQSVIPFGSFKGSSSAVVSPVISHNKPQNEPSKVIETLKFLTNNIVNEESAFKSSQNTIETHQPKTSNSSCLSFATLETPETHQPKTSNSSCLSFATLETPEFDHASKSSVPNSNYEYDISDDQNKGAIIDTSTPIVRILPCTMSSSVNPSYEYDSDDDTPTPFDTPAPIVRILPYNMSLLANPSYEYGSGDDTPTSFDTLTPIVKSLPCSNFSMEDPSYEYCISDDNPTPTDISALIGKRLLCTFEPEEPLPPIFSLFD